MKSLILILSLVFFFDVAIIVETSYSLLSPKGVNYEGVMWCIIRPLNPLSGEYFKGSWVAALMSLKMKLRDEYKVMDGWDINSVDPCTWNMVACSQEGFVISLEMASVGLSGSLSSSIGNLTYLQTMLLQNNMISGPIPPEIGKLLDLRTLDISGNQLDGEIPSSLGSLTRLSYLRLSRNKLSGHIPRSVANLSGLSFLDFSFNNLSGPTPRIMAKDYSITGNNFLCIPSSAQICLGASKPLNETHSFQKASSSHQRWIIPIVIGVSCTFIVSLMLIVCWVHWYRSRLLLTSYVQQDCEWDIGHLKRFSFRELQTATSNFNSKNIIGQGGFGVVYRGYLPNRSAVAVKRLRDPNVTGEIQFQTEVELIGLAVHRNLLRLYGFCMTPEERLLVYPYMSNGSVADRLRDSGQENPSLDWNKRMRIAIGAARGLVYLHEQCSPKIIHRDVKAANILLDENFEAIVGDFGLAKLLDCRDSHVTTAVRGTIGHIAPEYLSTGQSSEKTDVYGYGILLLELVTGPKAVNAPHVQAYKGMIFDWVRTLYDGNRLEELVDKDLKGCFNAEELTEAVEVALKCTQSNPILRPKMSEVLKVLVGISEQTIPAEESQGRAGNNCEERSFSFCRNSSDIHEESSFVVEAIELSGPR